MVDRYVIIGINNSRSYIDVWQKSSCVLVTFPLGLLSDSNIWPIMINPLIKWPVYNYMNYVKLHIEYTVNAASGMLLSICGVSLRWCPQNLEILYWNNINRQYYLVFSVSALVFGWGAQYLPEAEGKYGTEAKYQGGYWKCQVMLYLLHTWTVFDICQILSMIK